MKTATALQVISQFKGASLKLSLHNIKQNLLGKTRNEINNLDKVFEAAIEIKKVSSQIDEIVHATGIIQCLPKILLNKEKIIDLSLASSASGEGIDLITNKRIAEFKFSRWQSGANGKRRRDAFADLVNLYLYPSTLKKELYVFDADKVIKVFESNKATWRNILSKSGGLDKKLEKNLFEKNIVATFVNDIYQLCQVEIKDIGKLITIE